MNSLFSTPIGAYTQNSKGHKQVRQAVANYINQRDGREVDSSWNHITLTNGASEGVRTAMKMIVRDKQDGVLVPIPQYPLYSALLTLENGTLIKYYLDEEKSWGINADDILQQIKNAKDLSIVPRAIVVINPGNPTGNVLRRADIENIVKLCYEHNILILADEVYQRNIYFEDIPFISFRQVLAELGEPYRSNVELISFHSISKGLMGECGFRGGYMEAHNLDPFANEMLYKMKSIELCSNTIGQVCTHLMVDPPREGRESEECVKLYRSQRDAIKAGMEERAALLTKYFNQMTNVSANKIEGAMYAFPQVKFTKKALDRAQGLGVKPDFMYCMDMLKQTGIMTVPGSGFGQKPGTHHFRITNLVCPTEEMKQTLDRLKDFNEQFHANH